jgi:hypothetical protein
MESGKIDLQKLYRALIPAFLIAGGMIVGRQCTSDEIQIVEEIADVIPEGGQDESEAQTGTTSEATSETQ